MLAQPPQGRPAASPENCQESHRAKAAGRVSRPRLQGLQLAPSRYFRWAVTLHRPFPFAMNPNPEAHISDPPTSIPPALPPLKGHRGSASIVMLVVAWVFWGGMLVSWPIDGLIAALQPPRIVGEPARNLVTVFGLMAFIQLALTLFFRWLFFRFLIHPKRLCPGTWQASFVGIFGVLLIYSQIKSVEIYGFILWLQVHSWPHYLAFAVPSFVFLVLMIPALVIRGKADIQEPVV